MATPATWTRRVAQWKASGLTAAEYAAGKGYAPATLMWWSSRLNTQAVGGELSAVDDRHSSRIPLARVVVRRELASGAEQLAETPIAVELGGVRVVVRRGFDPEALRHVLELVGTGAGGGR